MSASTDPAAGAGLIDGVARILAGPPEQARALLRELAGKGLEDAQVRLGQMLLEGSGGDADAAEAFAWFGRAAASGHPMATNMLGRCHELGWGTAPDPHAAAHCYRAAATAGLDWGMYNYATALTMGSGVPVDRAAALRWFVKAADLGHAKATNIVGGFYEDGWEIEQDIGKAEDCYRRAGEGGDFRGRFNYGRILADKGDVASALAQFELAARGSTPAFCQMMSAYLVSSPVEEFRQLAVAIAVELVG